MSTDVEITAAIILALVVSAACCWTAIRLGARLREAALDARRLRTLQLLALLAPVREQAAADPRVVVGWQRVAVAARRLFPEESGEIDRAFGSAFPFGQDDIQQAHARWTTEWLAWERSHDAAYKLKAAEAAANAAGVEPALARSRVDAVEQEKLELYQRRYEEYVRVAKALQALRP